MRTILILSLVSGLALVVGEADAKRAPSPKYQVCNKTQSKQYFAEYNYAGRGRKVSKGWTYVKPGSCYTTNADYIHLRGKPKTKGLNKDKKTAKQACVTYQKVFRVLRVGSSGTESDCKKRKGKMVDFHPAEGNYRKKSDVEILPSK